MTTALKSRNARRTGAFIAIVGCAAAAGAALAGSPAVASAPAAPAPNVKGFPAAEVRVTELNMTNDTGAPVTVKMREYIQENLPFRTRTVTLKPGESLEGSGYNLKSNSEDIEGVVTYSNGSTMPFAAMTPIYLGNPRFGMGEKFRFPDGQMISPVREGFKPGDSKTLTWGGKQITVTMTHSDFEHVRFQANIR